MTCNKCRKVSCECSRYTHGVPTPYYNRSSVCEEDNCERIYVIKSSPGLTIQSSWNVPQCGGAAVLSVPEVENVPVGEYLHHPTFGYFLIIAFDAIEKNLSIQNTCISGNALPGTEIPSCTTFTVVPPPCCTNIDQSGVFVAIDFTAPAVSSCIDITVTSEEGLIAGNNVEIGTGVYSLSAVKAGNIITICNEGDGIIPGTSVIAKDLAGQYQYPVTLLSINPCAVTPVASGPVMICSGGVGSTLSGTTNGYVVTMLDHTTGEAHYADTGLTAAVAALSNLIGINTSVNKTGTVSFSGASSGSVTSNSATLTITNPSSVHSMSVLFCVDANFYGTGTGGTTSNHYVDAVTTLQIDFNFGGPVVKTVLQDSYAIFIAADEFLYGVQPSWDFAVTIAPLGNYNLQAGITTTISGAHGGLIDYTQCQATITAIGVAV